MAIQDSINSLWHSAGTAFSTIRVLSAAEALKAEKEAKAAEASKPKKTEEQIAAEKKEALVNKLAYEAANAEFAKSKESKDAGAAFVSGFGSKYDNMLDDADKTTRAGKKSKAANAEKTKNKYIEMYEKANKELGDFQESKSLQVTKKPKRGGSI